MHDNEVIADSGLVQRLIAAQFPEWGDLPLHRVRSSGTDHVIYRLGDKMCVRLPRIEQVTAQVQKEQTWLPRLADHLPLTIPSPLAWGAAGEGYLWPWSVYTWINGENATRENLADPVQAAVEAAGFIKALQSIDASQGPDPGAHNFFRGVALEERDTTTRNAIESLDGIVDRRAALRAWERALEAPAWDRAPVWIHGDLQPGNLLTREGHLHAVIDFGGLSVGDPACDLQAAWNLFTGEAREAFRYHTSVDDATWIRGRGWALSVGAIAFPYYCKSNPVLAGIARRAMLAVMDDS